MVKNPERDYLEEYDWMYGRNPLPHASVERFVGWSLRGEVTALGNDKTATTYFQSLLDKHLDFDRILRSMLVDGDAYALIFRNNGEIAQFRYLSSKEVEIKVNDKGIATEYIVDYGSDKKETYTANTMMHFKWKPQPNNPYGFSLLKGLKPLVERERKIMDDFVNALHAQATGKTTNFDSDGSIRVLESIPYLFAKETGVPFGLLTLEVKNETMHEMQMQDFEKLCQQLRDILRIEVEEKLIKPEGSRKGFQETVSIKWKRKNEPNAQQMQAIVAEYKLGFITADEAKIKLGVTEEYV